MSQNSSTTIRANFLTLDEERRLINTWQDTGDQNALKSLITAFYPFVARLAHEISDGSDAKPDLINDGNVALIECLSRYEPRGKTRFLSYARSFIRAAMSTSCRNIENQISIPAHSISKAKSDSPLGLGVMSSLSGSIDASSDEAELFASDDFCPQASVSQKQTISFLRRTLEAALGQLPTDERNLMQLRLLDGQETANYDLSMSPVRVRALEDRAMLRLRNILISQGFTSRALLDA